MFTDLSDIDETAQAKVGAEIWTVKSDKAPHSKGTKSNDLNFKIICLKLSDKPYFSDKVLILF